MVSGAQPEGADGAPAIDGEVVPTDDEVATARLVLMKENAHLPKEVGATSAIKVHTPHALPCMSLFVGVCRSSWNQMTKFRKNG